MRHKSNKSSPENERLVDRIILVILLLTILVAGFLRFYKLSFQSLWNDELSTLVRADQQTVSEVIEKGVKPDVHPPGYQILMHFVVKYFDPSASTLRMPSVASGILSVIAIFLLGTVLYSRREGLIAAVLVAVLWMPVYYSQEARAYSMILLFTTISSVFLVVFARRLGESSKPNRFLWLSAAGYIVTSIICAYFHYYGLLAVALQGITISLCFIKELKKLFVVILLYVPIVLIYTPWLPSMLGQLGRRSWMTTPGPIHTTFFRLLKFYFNNSVAISSVVLILYAIVIITCVYKASRLKRLRNLLMSKELILILWIVVPFLIVYVKSRLSTPVFTERNLIISAPAAYLLLAKGITIVARRAYVSCMVSVLLLASLTCHLVIGLDYYSRPTKEQFREVSREVISMEPAYENSIILACVYNQNYLNYYFERAGSEIRVDSLCSSETDIPDIIKVINQRRPHYVFFVQAHKFPRDQFVAFLQRNFDLVAHRRFIRANVLVLKPKRG